MFIKIFIILYQNRRYGYGGWGKNGRKRNGENKYGNFRLKEIIGKIIFKDIVYCLKER